MQSVKCEKIRQLLSDIKASDWSEKMRHSQAEKIAAALLQEKNRLATSRHKKQENILARLVSEEKAKVLFTRIADQVFRCQNQRRAVEQILFLLQTYGVPSFFTLSERAGLYTLCFLMRIAPRLAFALIKKFVRAQTRHVILDSDPVILSRYVRMRRSQGIEVNVNFIGEAVQGEEEAKRRVQMYCSALQNGVAGALSIKVSTIASQLSLYGFSNTLDTLKERFCAILDAALQAPFETLVTLDMEEYQHLELTKELYTHVLGQKKYYPLQVGIALQAYIPDSFDALQEIEEFAQTRCNEGGRPLRVRLVKGANLSTEKIVSAQSGWPQSPYTTKKEVDAHYKKMLRHLLSAKGKNALHVGVATHNLFDIAYAMLLAAETGSEEIISYELLEGMANPLPEVLAQIPVKVLVYAPVTNEREFSTAFAYLMRRLDETTHEKHFLKDAFGLVPGSDRWNRQEEIFEASISFIGDVREGRRRMQSRFFPVALNPEAPFDNDFHTDPTLGQNRLFASSIVKKWGSSPTRRIEAEIALDVEQKGDREIVESPDPSKPERVVALTVLANSSDIAEAVHVAKNAAKDLANLTFLQRSELLYKAACEMQKARADLIGAMMAEGGKLFEEADLEVSEAIDFIEYYRRNAEDLGRVEDVEWEGAKAGVVASPWNFPLAIPTGGIASLLLTGCSVLFKPAPEAPLIGSLLAACFYNAGVEKRFLQFIPCQDEPAGSSLIQNKDVDVVILTGASETAKKFLRMRKNLSLFAETGGKNAIIVTSLSDRDLSIRDILLSAFGHSGQKCSACSLAILEDEVYNDAHFLDTLRDAANSLAVGSVWDLHTKVGPLIRPPQGKLLQGLTKLEEGEKWLLEPKVDPHNPHIWSPGIKIGVQPGSFTQQTELFGPLLGVMSASSYSEALRIANSTCYGLTAGLQSLDKREQWAFTQKMEAGNLYVNRGITGAIVQRQPFGGCKASSFGPGKKTGGPNYLIQLMTAHQSLLPKQQEPVSKRVEKSLMRLERTALSSKEWELLHTSALSYSYYWQHYFCKEHDPTRLLGQDNFLRYVPAASFVYIDKSVPLPDVLRLAVASITCNAPCEIFCEEERRTVQCCKWFRKVESVRFPLSFEEWKEKAIKMRVSCVRTVAQAPEALVDFCRENAIVVYTRPVVGNGRIELVHFLREVSISVDYHRYGNLGLREDELRKGPLKSGFIVD